MSCQKKERRSLSPVKKKGVVNTKKDVKKEKDESRSPVEEKKKMGQPS